MYGHPKVMGVGEFMDMLDSSRFWATERYTAKECSPKKNTTGASCSPYKEVKPTITEGTSIRTPHWNLEKALEVSPTSAAGMLQEGANCLIQRATERDREGGERSMKACVEAFNALTGHKLSEEDGWLFMAVLKMSRSRGGNFRADDFVDGAAYMALAGEAAANTVKGGRK